MNSFFILVFFLFKNIICQKIEWDYSSVAKYIEKHFKNEKYFICDPNNYITEDEKEVITYRLVDILNKMYFNPIILVLNKIEKNNLKLNNTDDDYDDDEFSIQDLNSSFKLNNSNRNSNKTQNNYLKNFIYFLNKKIFNEKILSNIEDDNNILILFYTVEEVGLYLFRGKNVSKIITDNETDDLLIYRDQSIKKKKIYPAIDDVLINILYHHAKSTSDKIYTAIGNASEIIVFILIAGYYIYNWSKDNQNPISQNNNANQHTNNQDNNENNKNKSDNKKEKKD